MINDPIVNLQTSYPFSNSKRSACSNVSDRQRSRPDTHPLPAFWLETQIICNSMNCTGSIWEVCITRYAKWQGSPISWVTLARFPRSRMWSIDLTGHAPLDGHCIMADSTSYSVNSSALASGNLLPMCRVTCTLRRRQAWSSILELHWDVLCNRLTIEPCWMVYGSLTINLECACIPIVSPASVASSNSCSSIVVRSPGDFIYLFASIFLLPIFLAWSWDAHAREVVVMAGMYASVYSVLHTPYIG